MNWGKAITLSFILFAGFILSIVFMMMRQRVDLVREDYYKEEINYEKQLSRIKNTKQIQIKMQYSTQNQQIKMVLPSMVQKGEVLFFRPSDKNLDFKRNLQKDSVQNFDTSQMAKGRWQIHVYWTDGRYEYFKEEEIFIQ